MVKGGSGKSSKESHKIPWNEFSSPTRGDRNYQFLISKFHAGVEIGVIRTARNTVTFPSSIMEEEETLSQGLGFTRVDPTLTLKS